MNFRKLVNIFWISCQPRHIPVKDKVISSMAAFFTILILVEEIKFMSLGISLNHLIVASMGATTFLVFVAPHSPLAQPWPIIGGHLVSAAIGVACVLWIDNVPLSAAMAVSLSIMAMYWLRCLHPPGTATTLTAIFGGAEIHAIGWQFCYEIVAINVVTIVIIALIINNLIPNRRYPLLHSHHPHHDEFNQVSHQYYPKLKEDDFIWALSQMDDFIDISEEDLVDLYEFAVERALSQKMVSKE
jgi:CBS-domain-containing membrane protein